MRQTLSSGPRWPGGRIVPFLFPFSLRRRTGCRGRPGWARAFRPRRIAPRVCTSRSGGGGSRRAFVHRDPAAADRAVAAVQPVPAPADRAARLYIAIRRRLIALYRAIFAFRPRRIAPRVCTSRSGGGGSRCTAAAGRSEPGGSRCTAAAGRSDPGGSRCTAAAGPAETTWRPRSARVRRPVAPGDKTAGSRQTQPNGQKAVACSRLFPHARAGLAGTRPRLDADRV